MALMVRSRIDYRPGAVLFVIASSHLLVVVFLAIVKGMLSSLMVG